MPGRRVLTQALRDFAMPGAVAHAGEVGGEGELVAGGATVAHAGAPLKVAALQDAVGDGSWGGAGDGCRRRDGEVGKERMSEEVNERKRAREGHMLSPHPHQQHFCPTSVHG